MRPAHALANRGLAKNIVGYTVYGDYAERNPAARIVAGVAKGELSVRDEVTGEFGPAR